MLPLRESNNGALALGFWKQVVLTGTLTETAAALQNTGLVLENLKAFGPGFIEYCFSGGGDNAGGTGGACGVLIREVGTAGATIAESVRPIQTATSSFAAFGRVPISTPANTLYEVVFQLAGDGANAANIDPATLGQNAVVCARWVREEGD